MDIATIIGIVWGFTVIIYSIKLGGTPFHLFKDIPALLIVFGGMSAAVLVMNPMSKVIATFKIVLFASIITSL